MTKSNTIKINQDIYKELEKDILLKNNLAYLISFMVINNISTLPRYNQYSTELVELTKKYNQDKKEFEQFIINKFVSKEKCLLN